MRNVYLTGFSGSGKTTVARLLGARLGLRPRDLDQEIVARAGAPIAEIFAREGEAAFRRREAAALRAVAAERGQVVATGGGEPPPEPAAGQPGRGFRLGRKGFGRDRPLLCVPVVAETGAAALARARECAAVAPDAIELRADHLADLDTAAPEPLLDLLVA